MGHSEDNAVHKISHKIKKALKESTDNFTIGLIPNLL